MTANFECGRASERKGLLLMRFIASPLGCTTVWVLDAHLLGCRQITALDCECVRALA